MIQRPSPDGSEQPINVDLKELLEKGDLQRNVVVQGGDVIHIKERIAETIYVIGDSTAAAPTSRIRGRICVSAS